MINQIITQSLLILFFLLLNSCKNDYDLGNDYSIGTTAIDCRSIQKNCTLASCKYIVFGHVFDYNINNNFIIAKRVNQDSLFNLDNFRNLNLDDIDTLSKNFKAEFYIIDKRNDSIYGPLNELDFISKKKNLNLFLDFN